MARPVNISDQRIIDTARELFLERGLAATEMKDIAQRVGIGRSSLYRHFESKESLAFSIAAEILTGLSEAETEPLPETADGAAALLLILERYVERLIQRREQIRFLDEFDQLFSDAYPAGKAAADYIAFIKGGRHDAVEEALVRGAEDGSLSPERSPGFTALFLLNTLLGLAQRVLPRAAHYQEEQGYSLEFLRQCPRVLVQGISAK